MQNNGRKKSLFPYYQEYVSHDQDYSLHAFMLLTFQYHDADAVISTQYLPFSLWTPVMHSE